MPPSSVHARYRVRNVETIRCKKWIQRRAGKDPKEEIMVFGLRVKVLTKQ